VHGTSASLRDPARFAFAHGGKDGTPFPVDRATYDRTIEILGNALNKAAVDRSEKVKAFRRLGDLQSARFVPLTARGPGYANWTNPHWEHDRRTL
jgi:hypothetical protein